MLFLDSTEMISLQSSLLFRQCIMMDRTELKIDYPDEQLFVRLYQWNVSRLVSERLCFISECPIRSVFTILAAGSLGVATSIELVRNMYASLGNKQMYKLFSWFITKSRFVQGRSIYPTRCWWLVHCQQRHHRRDASHNPPWWMKRCTNSVGAGLFSRTGSLELSCTSFPQLVRRRNHISLGIGGVARGGRVPGG